ncbi:ATP-binding protein [Phytoactinopolyspora halotolerans]|uniref:ATP-grasp domain-containing protein n=1 Tax=Phytoactinopolyspora halotolerans TaxID=1981512 RepID=A0A6L9SHI4_9ACTN|nr:hypothetical protein [Phytoactinopolyspora halotolerans]NEE04098.1 hypothetical protein [Phytoactinopolyspora halotolerans]
MWLTEVLVTEVPGVGDPGPRSTKPRRLGIVARLSGTDAGRPYVGGAVAALPPGVQSPWNVPAMGESLDGAVQRLVGARFPDESDGARDVVEQVAARFAEAVRAHTGPESCHAALERMDRVLRAATLDLLARAGRIGVTAAMDARAGLNPDGADAAASPSAPPYVFDPPDGARIELARDETDDIDRGWEPEPVSAPLGPPLSLPRLVCWMGRTAWARSAPHPDPWNSTTDADRQEYGALGLEPLGKNSLDSYLLEREAHRLGLRTVRFHGVDVHAEDAAGRAIGFHCTTGPSTSRHATKICGDKQVTRRLLARAGVAVPEGRLLAVDDIRGAHAFAGSVGWPVVVKPADGKGGQGVTAGISGEPALERALGRLADAGHARAIVERHIPGADYRFLVVGDRVVSVVHRRPARVTGDGRSTVAELVLAKNLFRLRNPHLRSRLIRLDRHALALLDEQGLSPDSVPPAGREVPLTTAANLTRGGDSAEVLAETDPSLLDLAVRAVRAVPGLDHAGVDVLVGDHRLSLQRQPAAVCELNSLPGTTSHHFPVFGPSRNVSAALVEHYAERYGLRTERQPSTVSAEITVTGELARDDYRRWWLELMTELGLTGRVSDGSGDDRDRPMQARVHGPLELVSALSMRAIFGPPSSRPELVETRPR